MIEEQTLVVRMWRLRPWSGNRLMRGSDRLESMLVLFVVALILILVPLAAAFGTATNTRLNDQSRADRETRHQIAAVLLADATVNLADTTPATGATGQAPAQWAANGTTHTGVVQTGPETKAGQTISIWIDPDGNLADAPKTGTENGLEAVGAALALWTISATACLAVLMGIRWAEARYRLSQWDREWRNLGKAPGWPVS
ncbi:hypothetical protein CJ179_33935 [Rhodococcus sp. ACS1]|jgi:hypothetical protein|uniref:Transmembrane protein n=1 Tax=Rhodococcus koreensis TaxID=99653 RepID=A0A1H5EUK4_9NOCA|nr:MULTISPECIES: hypothetical protein [Rhodococcus]PBC40086.1 hypothetical protein CJ179_33935 [Rhodococcus sp. ACS1]SED94867.1 hypothetical protein SAMN04490239_9381 [Rhodococcus koreensis]